MKRDNLTDLFEREELVPYLDKLINENRQITLGLIDLNNFKKINDKYGHVFGDEVLKYATSTMKLTFVDRGTVFRYGGDEFIVIFPDQDKIYARILFKLNNRHLKKRPFLYGTKLLKVTVSYGIASYPSDAIEIKALINSADKAMYCSKKKGKGAITDIAQINRVKAKIFIRKILLWVVLSIGIFYAFISPGKFGVRKVIAGIRAMSIQKIPSNSCKVVLRNGFVFRGELIEKDKDGLTLSITLKGQKGKIRIDKSIIRRYVLYKSKGANSNIVKE